jgi:hypothetical protein
MNLSGEDKQLLDELCRQNNVAMDKVFKLLQTAIGIVVGDRP